MKFLATIALLCCALTGCNRAGQNQEAIRQGVIDYVSTKVNVAALDVNVTSISFKGAEAEASIRGNAELRAPVKFVRIEPYIVPKKSLTGDSTERVDTRVLQVIYSFDPKALPARVGQQMDVFIQAEGPGATQPATQTARASR